MKLPEDIDPVKVNNGTYEYQDALAMVEDMKRLRRKTGWSALVIPNDSHFVFVLLGEIEEDADPDKGMFAQFQIKMTTVHRTFWPSLYPNEPSVQQLRLWFLEKRGPHKIASMLNQECCKEPEPLPESASVWSRILSDDDDGLD